MASGDYIALFDHDDLLHPSVLYENMKAICEQGADFIYTDELTFQGSTKNITVAHFKPDFAIDNLRANNYICHFTVFQKSLLEKVGLFRSECDGSQDFDMVLRFDRTGTENRTYSQAFIFLAFSRTIGRIFCRREAVCNPSGQEGDRGSS